MVQRTYGAMTNDVLISIPLFVLMGYVMERGALVDKMFYSIQLAFRRVPASLAVATLIVCTFWGIASGLVGAVVVLMGVIAFNPMLKAGYDVKLASGVITAGGTLGHPDPALGDDHRLCRCRRPVGGQALCRGDVAGLLSGASSISSTSSAGRSLTRRSRPSCPRSKTRVPVRPWMRRSAASLFGQRCCRPADGAGGAVAAMAIDTHGRRADHATRTILKNPRLCAGAVHPDR